MRHSQIGWPFILILIPLVAIVSYMKWNSSELSFLWGSGLIVLLLFYKLTVIVDDTFVKYSFGIGLIKGKFLIADIESCRAKSYASLGWGIRYRAGTVIYNVSGNKAIELMVRGKVNNVMIGTDKPNEIADFINEKRGVSE